MRTVIAVHITAAVLSLVVGASMLLLQKGTTRHRLMGRVWVAAMFVTAVLSSFDIRKLNHGHLSWIHGLSVPTAVSLVRAIWAIRQGNVSGHAAAMSGSFIGLAVAGIAAVVTPHRLLNIVLGGWFTHTLW
ncbi:MAG: hypothetical protein CBARDMAM_5770 [uncultured Caballeronia sp.]|nr:MAG: hypothetical protein CBARDMAM_5770 [uncultured Caballeronia sp.]